MTLIVAAFALMIAALSVWGLIRPDALVRLVRSVTGAYFMPLAVGVRLALAALLWLTAASARHPLAFQVVAIIALVAAFVIVFLGKARLMKIIDWWAESAPALQRMWLLLGTGFGIWLLWEIQPAL